MINKLLAILLLVGCTSSPKKESAKQDLTIAPVIEHTSTETTPIKKVRVLIVPCSNGYDYETMNYDLTPLLEKHLANAPSIELVPFPLKAMQGSGYQGVYDKRYCDKILANVEVDYLIMTKMKGDIDDPGQSPNNTWGYETKVLNTQSMEQKIGISGTNLPKYADIDTDINHKAPDLIKMLLKP